MRRIFTFLIICGCLAPLTAEAGSPRRVAQRQKGNVGAAAQAELQRAEGAVSRAKSKVGGQSAANDLLQKARGLIAEGRRALARGDHARAKNRALRAQRLAVRAQGMGRVRRADPMPRRELAELDRRIEAVRSALSRKSDAKAKGLLQRARQSQGRARSAIAAGQGEQARRYIHAGSRAALQALERLKR